MHSCAARLTPVVVWPRICRAVGFFPSTVQLAGYRREERGRVEVEGTAAGLIGLVIITVVISAMIGLVKFS
jgi:hypothetical protein